MPRPIAAIPQPHLAIWTWCPRRAISLDGQKALGALLPADERHSLTAADVDDVGKRGPRALMFT
jgi:hypothetical protein